MPRVIFDGRTRVLLERRINPHERILKPIKRITQVKGKKYTHYVISTTVPEKWKNGVKVTIEPIEALKDKIHPAPSIFDSDESSESFSLISTRESVRRLKEIRRSERDLNADPYLREIVEKYLEEKQKETDHLDELFKKMKESSSSENACWYEEIWNYFEEEKKKTDQFAEKWQQRLQDRKKRGAAQL